jgi:hypothetical protein
LQFVENRSKKIKLIKKFMSAEIYFFSLFASSAKKFLIEKENLREKSRKWMMGMKFSLSCRE